MTRTFYVIVEIDDTGDINTADEAASFLAENLEQEAWGEGLIDIRGAQDH